MDLSADFWNQRYNEGSTGWDVGYPSTPIKEYIDTLKDDTIRILIPGAGNAYEAEYLHNLGFKNVHVLDFSEVAINEFRDRVPTFPTENIFHGNFFEHSGNYDLIIEQTFFCALHPSDRNRYADKMRSLLNETGKLAGLMFKFPLTEKGPPFGGDKAEYEAYFTSRFDSVNIEPCQNSIKPRQGSEYWVEIGNPKN